MNDPSFTPPRVQVIGDIGHADFAEAIRLLRAEALWIATPPAQPELIVVAQSRPGVVSEREVVSLRAAAPLAGVVGLLGTWCEGETRTGRPWPGVERRYWYEFPAWWRRQMGLRAARRCPDWARWGDAQRRTALREDWRVEVRSRGLVVLSAAIRETAAALADVLHDADFATVWQPRRRGVPFVRGAVAGIWDGGQLDEQETGCLARFCRSLVAQAAPVVALLDFPRRERCERARELGAAAVLGKPWLNDDLVATARRLASRCASKTFTSRAA